MKKLILILGWLIPALSEAQTYTINWHKISGGGGASGGGSYQLNGTIGQPDATGPLTGGSYAVTGGFWSLVSVVPTAGAPSLAITRSGGSVIISWPAPSTGFVLQQNSTLSLANWVASSFTVNTIASTNSVTIPAPAGHLFFRLIHP